MVTISTIFLYPIFTILVYNFLQSSNTSFLTGCFLLSLSLSPSAIIPLFVVIDKTALFSTHRPPFKTIGFVSVLVSTMAVSFFYALKATTPIMLFFVYYCLKSLAKGVKSRNKWCICLMTVLLAFSGLINRNKGVGKTFLSYFCVAIFILCKKQLKRRVNTDKITLFWALSVSFSGFSAASFLDCLSSSGVSISLIDKSYFSVFAIAAAANCAHLYQIFVGDLLFLRLGVSKRNENKLIICYLISLCSFILIGVDEIPSHGPKILILILLSVVYCIYERKNNAARDLLPLTIDPDSYSKRPKNCGAVLQKWPSPLSSHFDQLKIHIQNNKKSKRILTFLTLNFAFMFVELFYGVFSNSLGLISDACHMLFDCAAMAIGLYSSYAAHFPHDARHTFGHARNKALSGFLNSVFLLFVASSIVTEALNRLFDPPQVKTHLLISTSVAGLLVNLVGVVFFADLQLAIITECIDFHFDFFRNLFFVCFWVFLGVFVIKLPHRKFSMGHSHESDHRDPETPHGHGHHAHGPDGHHAHGDMNMKGLFLHVLVDTLGSVGVIVSAFLIKRFGWGLADPLCSLIMSVFIVAAAWPLLKESALLLAHRLPAEKESEIVCGLSEISKSEKVVRVETPHFWALKENTIIGSIVITVHDAAKDATAVRKTAQKILRAAGVDQTTIQVNERPAEVYQ